MKTKGIIKKEDLMKTVFKGRNIGKNYERVMEEVDNTLKNVIFKLFRKHVQISLILKNCHFRLLDFQ